MAPFLQELHVGRNGTWLWKCQFGILISVSSAENVCWFVRTRSSEARFTNRRFCNRLQLLSNLIWLGCLNGRDLTILCRFLPKTAPVAVSVSTCAQPGTRVKRV